MHWAEKAVCLVRLGWLRAFSVGWWTPRLLLKLFGSPEAVLLTSGCVLCQEAFFIFDVPSSEKL